MEPEGWRSVGQRWRGEVGVRGPSSGLGHVFCCGGAAVTALEEPSRCRGRADCCPLKNRERICVREKRKRCLVCDGEQPRVMGLALHRALGRHRAPGAAPLPEETPNFTEIHSAAKGRVCSSLLTHEASRCGFCWRVGLR